MKFSKKLSTVTVATAIAFSSAAFAGKPSANEEEFTGVCDDVSYGEFKGIVDTAYNNTLALGFGLPMWATLMDPTGKVCMVYATNGADIGGIDVGNSAWLGSRVISAQKANTANAFSLDNLSIPTGAISATVYPGGSLYGLQHSNPVDTEVAYEGKAEDYGTESDPLEGERVGGVNVFGGGIALYTGGVKVGAVGVSGDTSCRDASMAFNIRKIWGYDDGVPNPDELALVDPPSALFQQPSCGVNDPDDAIEFGVFIP